MKNCIKYLLLQVYKGEIYYELLEVIVFIF